MAMPKTLQETTATLTRSRDHLWQATKQIYEKTIKSAARGPSPSRRTMSFDATDFRVGRGGAEKHATVMIIIILLLCLEIRFSSKCLESIIHYYCAFNNPFFVEIA